MRAYLEVRADGGKDDQRGRPYGDGIAAVVRARSRSLVAMILVPFYKIAELFPTTRESAQRLGLVTIDQMVRALITAVENPPFRGQVQIVDVMGIRSAAP